MVLSRQERERLVLDLYNQGKNTREIAQEARMSFSAIGAILKKAEEEKGAEEQQGQKMSLSSQAYKLFSERRTLAQVAIALNLREPDVTKFYMEYCKLTQLESFCRIYDKIKDDIHHFVNLYILSKMARMDTQEVIRLLTIANNDLSSVECRCEKLKREANSLEGSINNSTMIAQELSDQISELSNTRDSYRSSCEGERRQMVELHQKMIRLEALVDNFQNNSEEYIKITRAVEYKVLGVLSNGKVLLRCALLSITESIRNDPERYRLIFYKSPSITDYNSSSSNQPYTVSYMYGLQQPRDYNTEANAAVILDEAEKLYNKIVKDCIDKTVEDLKTTNEASNSKPSSMSLLPRKVLSDVQKDSKQKLAAYTYRKEEEHTLIQSQETDNES
jgi:transposase-like protein